MNLRSATAVSLLLVMLSGLIVSAADTPATPTSGVAPITAVFKFVALRQGVVAAQPVLLISATPAGGGVVTELAIPNKDPKVRKLDPDPAIQTTARAAKAGDLFEVVYAPDQGAKMIQTIRPYDRPAEDLPSVFQFGQVVPQKIGVVEFTGVAVTKFLQPQTLLVPNVKSEDGKTQTDPAIMKQLESVKAGDLVEVQVEKSDATQWIKSIRTYQPPRPVEFVKATHQKVGDKDVRAMEVKDGATALVLLIDPESKDAAMLTGRAGTYSPGQALMVRTTKDDRGEWLLTVLLAPTQPKATPVPTPQPTAAATPQPTPNNNKGNKSNSGASGKPGKGGKGK